MGKVFKVYFSHWTIWVYIFLSFKLALLLLLTKSFSPLGTCFIIVILLAPFTEWLLHKYVLHGTYDPHNELISNYMEHLHVGHHREPQKIDYFFAPLSAGLTLPISFFFFILIFTQNLNWAASFSLSITLYFLFYEWIHLAHHIDEYKPKTQWGKRLKKAHKWHHFKNENYWWGITSALGDDILQTFPKPQGVSKSETVLDLEKRYGKKEAITIKDY